jgi:hypothetical protein
LCTTSYTERLSKSGKLEDRLRNRLYFDKDEDMDTGTRMGAT